MYKLIQELEAKLSSLLIDENIDLVEVDERIMTIKAELNKLISEGKGAIKKAEKLKSELRELENIATLRDEIEAKKVDASSLGVLQQELAARLADEDITDILTLLQQIAEQEFALATLVSETKGDSKKATAIKKNLEDWQSIKALADSIALLEQPAVVVAPIDEAKSAVSMERPKSSLPVRKATGLMRSQSTDERESIEVAFYHALSVIPECAEKSLSMLYGHFQNEMKKKLKTDPVLLRPEEVIRVFAQMKDQLAREGLDGALIAEILARIEPELSSDSIQKLSGEFWKLLKEIQPLDMELMLTLIDKTAVAGERIQGQDIILLLGGTGAGKSTTIHWLAGSEMQKTSVAGLKHIAPVKTLQSELESFITSPFTRSETRSINAVTISYSAVGSKAPGSVVLCDSPGFGDTDGAEIDIANGIGVVKAVRACRSVKPLILISQQSIGDRLQGISKLSRILVMFIGSIQQELPAFSYAFTKYYKEQEDEIHPLLDHKLKHLPADEATDDPFVALLTDIVKKTSNGARVLDPIKDKPGEFLDSLAATPAITNPQEVFRDFVTSDALEKLKEQLFKHQLSVHGALRRFDVELLAYKLAQLQKLNTHLSIHDTTKIYSECIREVQQFIETLMNETFSRIDKCLDDGNTAIEADLKECSEAISRILRLEKVRKAHLPDFPDLSSSCLRKIGQVQQDLLHRIKGDVQSESVQESSTHSASPATEVISELTVIRLNKMRMIVDIFSSNAEVVALSESNKSLGVAYQGACEYLNAIFIKSVETAKIFIEANEFSLYVGSMDQLKLMVERLGVHFNVEPISSAYQALQQELLDYVNNRVQSVIGVLVKEELTVEAINAVRHPEVFALLSTVEKTEGLQRHIAVETIPTLKTELLAQAQEYLAKVSRQIIGLCQAERVDFVILKCLLDLGDAVRIQPEVAYESTKIYQEMIDGIRHKIHALKELAAHETTKLVHQQPMDYMKFAECLSDLKASASFADHVSGVYGKEFEQVASVLVQHCLTIDKEVEDSKLSLEQYERVASTYQGLQQLIGLTQCRDTLPDIDAVAQKTLQNFSEKITATLKDIGILFEFTPPLKRAQFKEVFGYLQVCNIMAFSQLEIELAEMEKVIGEKIKEYGTLVSTKLNDAFEAIKTKGFELDSFALLAHFQTIATQLQELLKSREFYERNPLARSAGNAGNEQLNLYSEFFDKMPAQLLSEWCAADTGHLTQYLASFKVDLAELEAKGRVDVLYTKLQVVQALIVLDSFLPEGQRYGELSLLLESTIRKCNDSIITEIKLAARSGRYEELKLSIQKLDLKNPEMAKAYEGIKQDITKKLTESARELKAEVDGLKVDDVRTFTELMNRIHQQLKEALTQVSDYVPEKNRETLFQSLAALEQAMHKKAVQFCEQANSGIEKNQFHAVEVSLQQVQKMAESFAGILIGDGRKASNGKILLLDMVTEKKRQITKRLDAAVKKYSTLDVAQFQKEPPVELFNQLQSAAEDDPVYPATAQRLSALIQTQVTDKLALATKEVERIEEVQEQIALIESVQRYLPLTVFGALEPALKQAKEQVQGVTEKYQREFEEDAALGEIKKLTDKLLFYAKWYQYWQMKSVQETIRKLITAGAVRFKADLSRGDLITVLENLPKAWNDWYHYASCFGGMSLPSSQADLARYGHLYKDAQCVAICEELKTAVVLKLIESFSVIEKVREKQSDTLKILANHFDTLLAFMQLKAGAGHFYQEMLKSAPRLEERVKACFVKIATCFVAHQALFEERLQSRDPGDLKGILDVTYEADAFFRKVADYNRSALCLAETPQFIERLTGCLSYRDMRTKFAEKVLQWKDNVCQPFLHNEKTKTENGLERDTFYTHLFFDYKRLKQIKPLAAHIDSAVADVHTVEAQCNKSITDALAAIGDLLNKLLVQIPTNDAKIYAEFNIWYDNLRSFIEFFEEPALVPIAREQKVDIDRQFHAKIVAIRDEAYHETDLNRIVELLIKIKSVMLVIPAYSDKINTMLNELLSDYKKRSGGAQTVGMLGLKLNSHPNGAVAQMIINQHSAFQGYALSLRNEKTLRFTAENVIAGLRGDEVNKGDLLEQYKAFDQEYWSLVERGLSNRKEVQRDIAEKARFFADSGSESYRDKVRSLMARVFACWTLEHSSHYSEALAADGSDTSESSAKKNYLMQPHAAQVIAIFRLLGIEKKVTTKKEVDGSESEKAESALKRFTKGMAEAAEKVAKAVVSAVTVTPVEEVIGTSNHLIQVGTGEGKSVVLAVTSTVLALLGYEVNCACYSEYLSNRDYEGFQAVFQAFGLGELIRYGTFNKLCEDFINQHGNIRGLVEETVKGNSGSRIRKTASQRPRILLIDEVDVFFNKDFYGNLYRPIAKLVDPTITALINYLWSVSNDSAALKFSVVKLRPEYQACLTRFSGWTELIEESVKALLSDLKTFESHDYIVLNDQIGYKEQDGISFEASYGYKTLFAYYKECVAGKVSTENWQSRVAFYIDCGSFSYAEIPKQYHCVMGVSGTLETLSRPEQKLLTEVYKINKRTFMPSVFGASQLQFAAESPRGIIIEPSEGYFMAIRNEINARLESLDGSNTQRAVLVFFESTPKLLKFYHSREFQDIKDEVRLMTEEVSAAQKEGLIRQAVTSGSVTLLTREFGRGTDFICYDDRLIAAGGVHVIQTFVSEELSEETQIKGRTARQGNKGSFSMVLLDAELEKFKIHSVDIESMKAREKMYSTITELRCRFFEGQYPEHMRYVAEILADHQNAQAFVDVLVKGKVAETKAFLLKQNKAEFAVEGGGISRTICLMDATGSMSGLLQKAKNTVKTMFERAHEILTEQGFQTAFELQFAVYRNYGSGQLDHLLQVSTWETNPENLRAFISSLQATGGGGPGEAVEIGLAHANMEADKTETLGGITQVILIGDAPANRMDQVRRDRGRYGESYWQNTPFSQPTDYLHEISKLKERQIPVHAFYLNNSAKPDFIEIAMTTGGRTAELDINSSAGADMLTNLVTEQILTNVGGADNAERLVSAYRAKFSRGYVSSANESISKSSASLFHLKNKSENNLVESHVLDM